MGKTSKIRKIEKCIKKEMEVEKRRDNVTAAFRSVFSSMQMCAWYVLYAPEYFDWDYTELKRFSDRMDRRNIEFYNMDLYFKCEEEAKNVIGIDFEKESKNFPFRAKVKMYGKKVPSKHVIPFVKSMNKSIECAIFIVVYTLWKDFGMSKDDICNLFVPHFFEISHEYANGLTNEHMMKYFKELEGWEIFEEEDGVYGCD